MPLLVWAVVLAVLVFAAVEVIRWLRASQAPRQDDRGIPAAGRRYSGRALSETLDVWYLLRAGSASPAASRRRADTGTGRRRSPGCSSWHARRTTPSGCCGLSSPGSWSWPCACGNCTSSRLRSSATQASRWPAWCCPRLAAFLYAAWSDPAKRRTIGVLWDVGTFWPRSYHPLSPPCYTERAVPDLQRRMWWLHDNDGQVMLTSRTARARCSPRRRWSRPAAGPPTTVRP